MENPQVVYVFNGKRILEYKIIEYYLIGDNIQFIRVENMGIVIFDRGESKVKKGEVVVALDKRVFGDESLITFKNRLVKLNSNRNITMQNRNEILSWIEKKNKDIENCDKQINEYDLEIKELRENIANHYKLV